MKGSYNFSQHLYCVNICFDEKKIYVKYFISGIKQGINRGDYIEERNSILYRITTEATHQLEGEIMYTGAEADSRKMFFEKDESVFYADSVFFELYNIYQKKKKREICDHAYDFHSTILTRAITTHLKTLKIRSPLANRYRPVELSDCHFAVTLPTSWDDETKAEMIRPLFVRTGLITETDHPDKLLFFNQLQSDFRYLQFLDDYERPKISRKITNRKKVTNEATNAKKNNSKITNGKKCYTCLLTFTDDELSVVMDLFLVCYPDLSAIDNYYDAKKLGSVSFGISLDSETKRYVELYGKIDSLNMEKVDLDDMSILTRFISDFRMYDHLHGSSVDPVLERLLDLQEDFMMLITKENFQSKESEDFLNSNADKIRGALIAIMKAIYAKVMYPFNELFWRNIKGLNCNNNSKTYHAILILRGMHATERDMVAYKILLKWLEESLHTFDQYDSIVFGNNSSDIHLVSITDILVGTANQIKQHIQKTNSARDPLEIGGNRTEKHCDFPLMPLLTNSAPKFIINLDMTFDKIKFLCTYMETDNSVRKFTEYSECNAMPLSHFFAKLNKYQRPALSVDTRMRQFMGSKYDQLLKPPSNERDRTIENLLIAGGQNDTSDFSGRGVTETLLQSKDSPDAVFMFHQEKYIRLALVMYLRYINDTVTKKLTEFSQCIWIDQNIGYIISIEKTLLDDVFGSKQYLEEILFESGMLQETNQCRKARIVSKEEGILPIIQQSLALSFPLRSYSAIAQLHKNHVQLTLHQVVKLTIPPGDLKYDEADKNKPINNVSDIIVQDTIIPIQNLNDDICSNVWNHIKSYGVFNYCTLHKDQNYPSSGHYSLGNYKHGLKKLKQHIDEILSSEHTNLNNIDEQQKFIFGDACDCYFDLSFRTIVDAGFKPCLQKLATTIAASLTNTCVFGNYDVDFIFLFGYLHDLPSVSPLYRIYKNMLQKAIDASIKTKRLQTQGFVLNESLDQLTHKHFPFLGNTLTVGRLYQSSSETYGIYIGASHVLYAREHNLSGLDYKCNSANAVLGKNSAMIVLQKGQPIPSTGCVKKFKINFTNEDNDKCNYEVLELAVIKLKHSEVIPSGIVSLDNISYDKISTISIGSEHLISGMYVYLEIQPNNNHDSSLQFSLRLHGFENEPHNDNCCLIITPNEI